MDGSVTRPYDELHVECQVIFAPSGWTELRINSTDDDNILAVGFANGTAQRRNNSYLAAFQQDTRNISLRLVFPNTTTHCSARGEYICTLLENGNEVLNTTAAVIITDDASNIGVFGNTTHKAGDRYDINCTATLATEGSDLHLYIKAANSTDLVRSDVNPVVTIGDEDDACYRLITKTYRFIAENSQNGTELRCVATNRFLVSNQSSDPIEIDIKFADFRINFHLNTTWSPEYGDTNSREFKDFAAGIENDTDFVYGQSSLKDNYKRSKVIGLEEGSVKVLLYIEITIVVVITDSNQNVITTTLNVNDITNAFVDTLSLVSDQIPNSNLNQLDPTSLEIEFTTSVVLPETGCDSKTDLIFLLDESGSIGYTHFQTMKYFIKNFTASVAIGRNALQIGVVKFSSNPTSVFWLNEYDSPVSITNAVANIGYRGGGTQIGTALTYVRAHAFTTPNGARLNATRVIVLMTDGRSGDNPDSVAATLRSEGVLVVSIGIGGGVNIPQLHSIAYNSTFVFQVSDFNVLIGIKDIVQSSSCDFTNDRKKR